MGLQDAKDALSLEFWSLSCESMFIDVKTQWIMQCVSKSFSLAMVKARSMWNAYVANISHRRLPALSWIRTTDAGLADFVPSVYVYHADMLMRSFMFNVLRSKDFPVLAGSVGTALLMNKIGAVRSWIPNDVDFFAASQFQMERITNAYIEDVLNPLACDFHKDVLSFDAETENEEVTLTTESRSLSTLTSLNDIFSSWGVIYQSFSIEKTRERNGRGYRAVAAAVVVPLWPDGTSNELRSLILPLSVTFVQPLEGHRRFQPHSFAQRVRCGFDLMPCAVSVKMRRDLSFLCSCSPSTLAGLRNSALEINAEEVIRRRSRDLKKTVHRILKYLRRGFSLEHVPSPKTTRSIEEEAA